MRHQFEHPPERAETQRAFVVVAMSGGVDSPRSPLYCNSRAAPWSAHHAALNQRRLPELQARPRAAPLLLTRRRLRRQSRSAAPEFPFITVVNFEEPSSRAWRPFVDQYLAAAHYRLTNWQHGCEVRAASAHGRQIGAERLPPALRSNFARTIKPAAGNYCAPSTTPRTIVFSLGLSQEQLRAVTSSRRTHQEKSEPWPAARILPVAEKPKAWSCACTYWQLRAFIQALFTRARNLPAQWGG